MAAAQTDHLHSLIFRLGVIGSMYEARFTEVLAPEQIKPKHVALLGALRTGTPGSQFELATRLQVAPSLVVALVDQLEALGAIARERDPSDRRRQRVALTPEGTLLLSRCDSYAAGLDAELREMLGADAGTVSAALGRLGARLGLPED
jgi:DNA-binding MarR family transcriptional regulator